MASEEVPLEKACLFNNNLRCHPRTAGKFNSDVTFVEKVCNLCPTYKFIAEKGIP